MRVFVYWNLHKKCWSLRDLKTRRVIGHKHIVTLSNCEFKVSEPGRQRVLREKRKNVHAGVVGDLTEVSSDTWVKLFETPREAYYNPYITATFINKHTGEPIKKASTACLTPNKMVFYL